MFARVIKDEFDFYLDLFDWNECRFCEIIQKGASILCRFFQLFYGEQCKKTLLYLFASHSFQTIKIDFNPIKSKESIMFMENRQK